MPPALADREKNTNDVAERRIDDTDGTSTMPDNEKLEERINEIVSGWKNTAAKKMFGGICHLVSGNMFCGVYKDFLILRIGETSAQEALELPYAKPFDITGRAMKGWIMVDERGFKTDEDLKKWLIKAKQFADSLLSK
jgi:TfoX/Sxy family transcriptional regulator of competence genes